MVDDPSRSAKRRGPRPGTARTREDILAAARSLFAERGFAATSVRAVAAEAGVDAALVHHYFGTKDELFRATLEVPVDLAAVVARIVAAKGPDAGRVVAETFVDVWEGPSTGPAMVAFLRRTLADGVSTELLGQFAAATVIQRAAEGLLQDVDAEEARARVSMVVSQLLGVAVTRYVLGIDPLTRLSREELVGRLAPALDRHLAGLHA